MSVIKCPNCIEGVIRIENKLIKCTSCDKGLIYVPVINNPVIEEVIPQETIRLENNELDNPVVALPESGRKNGSKSK